VSLHKLSFTHLSHLGSLSLAVWCLAGASQLSASQAPQGQGGTAAGAPSAQGAGRQAGPPDGRGGRAGDASGSTAWKWWNDLDVRRELKLTDEKARAIEAIFEKRQAEVKPWVDQLQKEQDRLNRMTQERLADVPTFTLQVSKLEALRSRLQESRTVMLYRIFLELQPDQFKKFQDIMDRRRRSDGRGRGSEAGR